MKIETYHPSEFEHGRQYHAFIQNTPCMGRVAINPEEGIYLCQDRVGGYPVSEDLRQGHKFSYVIAYYDKIKKEFRFNTDYHTYVKGLIFMGSTNISKEFLSSKQQIEKMKEKQNE